MIKTYKEDPYMVAEYIWEEGCKDVKSKEHNRKEYYFKRKLHREDDEPTIIWENGDKEWIKDGLYHRVEAPARIGGDGEEQWWYEGKQFFTNNLDEFKRMVRLRGFLK